MTSTQASNPRASLLAGLRTGGVRSSSMTGPYTAGPNGAFNVNRYPSQQYYEEEEEDQFYELPDNTAYHNGYGGAGAHPMTAAVDGHNNRFNHQQQQRGLNPHSAPFNPSFSSQNNLMQQQNKQQAQAQAQQAFQMQLMQLELLKMQVRQNCDPFSLDRRYSFFP